MIDRALARRLAAVARDRLGDDVAPYIEAGVASKDFPRLIEIFSVISSTEMVVRAAIHWSAWDDKALFDPCPLASFQGVPIGEPGNDWERVIADALLCLKTRNISLAREANSRWDFDFQRPYLRWQKFIQDCLLRPEKKHPDLKFDPDDIATWIVDLAHHCAEFRSDSGREFERKNTLIRRILGAREVWDIEGMRLRRWASDRGA